MKKTLFSLVLILLTMSTVFADTDLDISMKGTVKEQFWLKLPVEEYKGEIAVSGMTHWDIGTVVMASNIKNWVISVESKNGGEKPGFLVNPEDPSETVPYTFSLGTLTPKRAELPWKSNPQKRTPKKGVELPFSIYLTADDATFYEAGIYNDVIILTILRK